MNTYKEALKIDAIGAIFSALGSLLILKFMNASMEVPEGWLIFTVFYALGILIFDVVSIKKLGNALRHCLMITVALNSIFVLLAINVLVSNWLTLNSLGVFYLILEIVIVAVLSVWQLTVVINEQMKVIEK